MPGGRPTKYREHFPQLAEAYALAGMTDEEIADKLEISTQTLYDYDKAHPEFLDARKRGKETPDDEVESALLRRAKGGFVKSVVTRKDGETIEAYAEPDTTACIFWLCNRRPKSWRHVNRVEITGGEGGPVQLANVTGKVEEYAAAYLALEGADAGDGVGEPVGAELSGDQSGDGA
jgi:hypothetical protein